MNPVMLEHHSRVENARRARDVEHIQRINQAHSKQRQIAGSTVDGAPRARPGPVAFMLAVKHWLLSRNEGSVQVHGDS